MDKIRGWRLRNDPLVAQMDSNEANQNKIDKDRFFNSELQVQSRLQHNSHEK